MKWKMSFEDIETMLKSISKECDTLTSMIWAVIMKSKKKLIFYQLLWLAELLPEQKGHYQTHIAI